MPVKSSGMIDAIFDDADYPVIPSEYDFPCLDHIDFPPGWVKSWDRGVWGRRRFVEPWQSIWHPQRNGLR